MAERIANNAVTTLAAGVSAGATSFAVTASTSVGFPNSGTFAAIVDNEIVTVTAVSGTDGTTWTVSRATEPVAGSQVAASHLAGAQIALVLTARSLATFLAAGGVASVFGRSGAVVAQSGDYTAAQVGAPSGSGISTGLNSGDQTIQLIGDVTGAGQSTFTTTLAASGVLAGTYGDANNVARITVDLKGRITSVSSVAIAGGGGSTGTVTSVATGTGLTGGPVTTTGTIALTVPVLVSSGGTGIVSLTANAVLLGAGTSPIGFATIGTAGRLLIDQGAGNAPAFTAMGGDATITAAGVLTVGAAKITNAKLANSSLTVTAGSGLSGGGAVSLGGTVTISLPVPITVDSGGSGVVSHTPYAVLLGGTTATGPEQDIGSLGTSGQVLTSQGIAAAPSWQTITGTGSVTSVSGSGGSTGLTLAGGPITTVGTLTIGGTLVVANGGTGAGSLIPYAVLCGGTTSTGAVQSVASVGTAGQILTSNGAGNLPTFQAAAAAAANDNDNLIINGGFHFAQRQAPATATAIATPDSYSADRWKTAQQTGGMKYRRRDTNGALEVGITSRYYGEWSCTGAGQKFVVYQILESANTFALASSPVIFQAKMSGNLARTIRMGILQLNGSGTIDTVPASLVTTWNGNTTDPTWGTNVAVITGAQSKSVGTSWANFTVSVTLPSDAKNLILAVWSDSQVAVNDTLFITEVGLYDGSGARNWLPRLIGAEFELCQRYYQSSYDLDVAPGTVTNSGRLVYTCLKAGGESFPSFTYSPMRRAPTTANVYSTSTGAVAKAFDANLPGDLTASMSAGQKAGFVTVSTAHAINDGVSCQYTLEAEL